MARAFFCHPEGSFDPPPATFSPVAMQTCMPVDKQGYRCAHTHTHTHTQYDTYTYMCISTHAYIIYIYINHALTPVPRDLVQCRHKLNRTHYHQRVRGIRKILPHGGSQLMAEGRKTLGCLLSSQAPNGRSHSRSRTCSVSMPILTKM